MVFSLIELVPENLRLSFTFLECFAAFYDLALRVRPRYFDGFESVLDGLALETIAFCQ